MRQWYGYFNSFSTGGEIGMMFFGIILIGIVIYFLVKGQNQNGTSLNFGGSKTPEEIAKERLAKGEITLEDYEKIKKTLQ